MIILILFSIFTGRCIAQLYQFYFDASWLPPFSAWQSGALPYLYLLAAQVFILVLGWKFTLTAYRGRLRPSASNAKWISIVSQLYGGAMLTRLVIGLFFAPHHYWFSSTLPTVFHLVLALWLYNLGKYFQLR